MPTQPGLSFSQSKPIAFARVMDSAGLPPEAKEVNPVHSLLPEVYSMLAALAAIPALDAGYLQSLHRFIASAQKAESAKTPFALFPLLCCQAAGGEPRRAIAAAAAWRALHLAAKLLDDVEDGDAPAIPGVPVSASSSINLSTGLFSAAGLALLQLEPDVQKRVMPSFYRTILHMSSGQHVEFAQGTRTLNDYMTAISSKSGQFFALAASSGAHCGTDNEQRVSLLEAFGFNVGILLQIMDDYLDWRDPESADLRLGRETPATCLIRSVGTEEQRTRLEQLLAQIAVQDSDRIRFEVRSLATEVGADEIMLAEMVRYKVRALAALEDLDGPGAAGAEAHDSQPLREWFGNFSAFVPG